MDKNTEHNREKGRISYLGNNSPAETVIALRMFVRDALGTGERDVHLRKDQIGRYYAGDEELSVLETTSKEKIYVHLPFTELCRKMEARSGRGNIIDLTPFTGAPVTALLNQKKIAGIFNAAAVNETVMDDDVLVLMDGYPEGSNALPQKIVFLASDITKYDDGFIRLQNWKDYRNDWNMADLSYGPYIRISSGDLERKINQAIQNGEKVLNLTDKNGNAIKSQRIKFSNATHHLKNR